MTHPGEVHSRERDSVDRPSFRRIRLLLCQRVNFVLQNLLHDARELPRVPWLVASHGFGYNDQHGARTIGVLVAGTQVLRIHGSRIFCICIRRQTCRHSHRIHSSKRRRCAGQLRERAGIGCKRHGVDSGT